MREKGKERNSPKEYHDACKTMMPDSAIKEIDDGKQNVHPSK